MSNAFQWGSLIVGPWNAMDHFGSPSASGNASPWDPSAPRHRSALWLTFLGTCITKCPSSSRFEPFSKHIELCELYTKYSHSNSSRSHPERHRTTRCWKHFKLLSLKYLPFISHWWYPQMGNLPVSITLTLSKYTSACVHVGHNYIAYSANIQWMAAKSCATLDDWNHL